MRSEIERIRKLGYSLSSAVDMYLEFMKQYGENGEKELGFWLEEQEKLETEEDYVWCK